MELTKTNDKNILTLDSREVAEMVGKQHAHLLRDIETYKDYLGESNFGFTDFFIESTYISIQNKKLPNYQITKKGCELIAHKLTGKKGILFTATYINKFHNMEELLKENSLSLDIRTDITNLINSIVSTKVNEIEQKCSNLYRPSCADKYSISQYIKKRLGINKANEEYELVKQRVLIKLNAIKWEDVPSETLRDSLKIIDESISIIKSDRKENQVSIFD